MTAQNITELLKECIINNSNIEAEADDSIMFQQVDNIQAEADSTITVAFQNGESFRISVSKL